MDQLKFTAIRNTSEVNLDIQQDHITRISQGGEGSTDTVGNHSSRGVGQRCQQHINISSLLTVHTIDPMS